MDLIHKVHKDYKLILRDISALQDSASSETVFISAYLPRNTLNKIEVTSRLTIYILNAIKGDKRFNDVRPRLTGEIKQHIEKSMKNITNEFRGIALFARISTDPENKDKLADLRIVTLPRTPIKEVTVNKKLDLDQFMWIIHTLLLVVVVQVSRKKARIFSYQDTLELVHTINNPYALEKEAREYLQTYSTTANKNTLHGTGDNTRERREQNENLRFTNEIADWINGRKALKSHSFMVLFYPHSFSPFIDHFKDRLHTREILSVQKTITNSSQLAEEVRSTANKYLKSQKEKLYEEAKSSYNLFVSGWNEVTKAANSQKVEKIFIGPSARKRGYVVGDLLYSYPVKGSSQVQNISPWLVQSVVNNGGDIVLMKSWKGNRVSAKLRY